MKLDSVDIGKDNLIQTLQEQVQYMKKDVIVNILKGEDKWLTCMNYW